MIRVHSFLCNLLPVCKNKVVLYAGNERYGGNIRCVAEELASRGCDVVWVAERNKVQTMKGIRSTSGRHVMRYELATAHIIVSDSHLPEYWTRGYIKKPGQVYIHARHGSFGIAKEEADVHTIDANVFRKHAEDSKYLDYLVSNCTWHTNVYRGNYLLRGSYLQIGMPRNDRLVTGERQNAIKAVQSKYAIHGAVKLALYTPVQRPWGEVKFAPPDYKGVLSALEDRFGGKWVMLVHSDSLRRREDMQQLIPKASTVVLDARDYPDTTELLVAADVMIGDYSGCTFDFLLTSRPTFFYAPDVEKFEEYVGLYEPLDSVPIPFAGNSRTLISNIKSFSADTFAPRIKDYLRVRGNADDGCATTRFCDFIQQYLRRDIPNINVLRCNVIKDALFKREMASANREVTRILGVKIWERIPDNNPWKSIPVKRNKIVFRTNNRMCFNGDPKYIAQEIMRRKLPFDLVWVVSPYILRYIKDVPDGIRLVTLGTSDALSEYATARIWIENDLFNPYVSRGWKRADQIWIQAWHATIGIKREYNKPVETLKQWERQYSLAKSIDYYIVGSDREYETRKKQFVGSGECLKIGHPKNDIYFRNNHMEVKKKVCNSLGIDERKKILLYAPTWREQQYTDIYNVDFKSIINACKTRFSDEWVVVGRLHFSSHYHQGFVFNSGNEIYNATEYGDAQELLVAADILITDYSSLASDFLLTKRPCFLYMPDVQRYKKAVGLMYKLDELPFPCACDNEGLKKNVLEYNEESFLEKRERFLKRMGKLYECGNASEQIVNILCKLILPTAN